MRFASLVGIYRHLDALWCRISLLGAEFCTYVRKRESDKKTCRYFVLSKQKVET